MRRTIVAAVVLLAALAVAGIPGAALAGGGCHGEPTPQRNATGTEEVSVQLVDACFDATITKVDPGTQVSFVNEDLATHNVGGVGWGHYEDLNTGDTYTATFDEAGIYPFACSYHLGMTGAIVVGDGTGAGNGLTVSTTPPDLSPVGTRAAPASSTPWIVMAAIGGLAIGATATIAVRRTKPVTP